MTKFFQNGQYVDPVNGDAVSFSSEEKATANVQKAHKVLPELRANASRWSELSEYVTAVETAIDQAERFEDERDASAANVRLCVRERDAAGRKAIRAGEDPVTAEESAEKSLGDARDKAARLERYRTASAHNAADIAQKATSALEKVKRDNSETIVRERLEALETARVEAIEAAQDAARKLHAVDVHVLHARQAAKINPDSSLSGLVRSPYDPDERRIRSTQLTVNKVIQELHNIPDRLSYVEPGGSRPTALGSSLGKAVQRVQEQ